MNAPVIELTGICKTYNPGQASEVQVLHDIDLCLQAGEFAALVGPSGSGKSTLLNILGLLERPTAGSYRLQGQEVANLDDERLTLLRRRTLGFVFQFHHLLPAFTALENVTLPALMAQGRVGEAPLARARELLVAVGLERAMDRRPSQLSGGMLQRVAIARALMPQPAVVLADEPTGNLDTASSDDVFALMRRIHAEHGTCFLIVTHDPRLSDRCDRRIVLVDGRIAQDTRKPAAPSGAEVFP
ncbi:MAG: hypothetical protein RL522_346 [Pseudomonadota bacterium]|jgi:lipoprotein-releasing system ATP-binding protein